MNLRKEAKGRECQIRIPGRCNGDPETTVLCHIHKPSISGGTGLKARDEFGAWGCSTCHVIVDGRDASHLYPYWDLELWLYEGVFRTQNILLNEGKFI